MDPVPPAKLAYGQILVVKSDDPFLLFDEPQNVVKVTKMVGPVTVYGKFVDGTGMSESRIIAEKNIAVVEATKADDDVVLIYTKVGSADEKAAQRLKLQINAGRGALPPPPKPVDPKVDPKPVDPVKVSSLRVLIVEDEANRGKQTKERLNILFSVPFRKYLDSVTPYDSELKQHEWYIVDKDTDMSTLSSQWQELRKNVQAPWTIVVADAKTNKILTSEALPASIAATTELCKKYLETSK